MDTNENEIDFTEAPLPSKVKESAKKITEHFTGTKTDAEVFAEKEIGQLMDKELSEELLKEYLELCEEVKAKQKIKDTLRAELISLAGKERGQIQRGKYVLSIEDLKPRVTVDWDRYVLQMMGEKSLKQLKNDVQLVKDGVAECLWAKKGEPSIEVSVSKING